MARLAVFASGNGSNFQAIAETFQKQNTHETALLVFDRKKAPCRERAERLGIPAEYVRYPGHSREEAETEILKILQNHNIDMIALAGYMRLFTPVLIDGFPGKIINIHPSLLPKHPGTDGICDSFRSGDAELGITIHEVDYGMDTGPVIVQKSFFRSETETLESAAGKIHALEHRWYPEVILDLLNSLRR